MEVSKLGVVLIYEFVDDQNLYSNLFLWELNLINFYYTRVDVFMKDQMYDVFKKNWFNLSLFAITNYSVSENKKFSHNSLFCILSSSSSFPFSSSSPNFSNASSIANNYSLHQRATAGNYAHTKTTKHSW